MEQLIADLKKIVSFKDSINTGDIVLIAAKEPPTLIYALVGSIEKDSGRKDEWWHVTMSLLTVPPQKITWTLRTPQMTGMESFSMGGEARFMKVVDLSIDKAPKKDMLKKNDGKSGGLKRVK